MRKPLAVLSFAAWCLLAFAGRAGAGEPARLPLPDPMPEVSEWYGLYMSGQKFGWAHETFGKSGEGDAAAYVSAFELHMKVEALGEKSDVTMRERREFDAAPPFAFRGGSFRSTTRRCTPKWPPSRAASDRPSSSVRSATSRARPTT